MKPGLLRLLACPACQNSFTCKTEVADSGKVIAGKLHCGGCGMGRFALVCSEPGAPTGLEGVAISSRNSNSLRGYGCRPAAATA